MPLNLMEHFLVLTDDIDQTRDFYIDVLGLSNGFRADLGFTGYWLYLDEIPVIHIAGWDSYAAHSKKEGIPASKRSQGTGCFDHIAFNGSDVEEMLVRLEQANIPYVRNDVPHINMVQLFLEDPNGIKVELNYVG